MPTFKRMSSFQASLKSRLEKWNKESPPPETAKTKKMAYNMHVALPLYMYPSPGVWQPLFDAVNKHPSVEFDVIINPNNGPGSSPPDSNYISNIGQLNTYSNVHLLGYVHTTYGTRNLSDIEADIDMYQDWINYTNDNITVGGIFVDESPSSTDNYPYMKSIYNKIKSTMTNGNLVWTNPGVPVDSSFYQIADMINAYENSYDVWKNQGGNASIPVQSRSKSTVLLHSYPSDVSTMQVDVDDLADGPYYGGLIIMDNNYSKFDDSWQSFVAAVDYSKKDESEC